MGCAATPTRGRTRTREEDLLIQVRSFTGPVQINVFELSMHYTEMDLDPFRKFC